jgi:putative flippase GtrA
MAHPLFTDRPTQWRLLRFLTVGGTAFAVQWTTMKLLSGALPENVAFTCSFLCSSATHYSLNRFWALPSQRRDSWRQFGEYVLTVAISWVINLAMFRLCRDVLGLGRMWATAVAIPPSTIVVFLLLNFRVFRTGKVQPATDSPGRS